MDKEKYKNLPVVNLCDLRADEIKKSLPRETILKGKENDGQYFIVPLLVGEL